MLKLRRRGAYSPQNGTLSFCESLPSRKKDSFWQNKEDARPFLEKEKEAIKPPFVYVFPSFYNWSQEAAPIQKNHELFQSWLANNGKTFEIVPS